MQKRKICYMAIILSGIFNLVTPAAAIFLFSTLLAFDILDRTA